LYKRDRKEVTIIMRIAGYIEHPILKITIFHYQGRFSLKLENNQFEETFKLSEEQFPSVEDVRALVTTDFLEKVQERFVQMSQQMKTYLVQYEKNTTDAEEDWPQIY
jgi:alpha-acetolactate decarboxylase